MNFSSIVYLFSNFQQGDDVCTNVSFSDEDDKGKRGSKGGGADKNAPKDLRPAGSRIIILFSF